MKVDGKALAEKRLEELEKCLPKNKKMLAIIEAGEHPASRVFVLRKKAIAEKLGIGVKHILLPENVSQEELEHLIAKTCQEDADGIIIQLPLPKQINAQQALDAIPEEKDIDMLRSDALLRYETGKTNRIPPVAYAIKSVLEEIAFDAHKKNVVIIGKGRLVGMPVASYFTREGIAFFVCDEYSDQKEVSERIKNADLIISGTGKPGLILPDMIKDGVILIDAGTSEQAGKLAGDIDSLCYEKASWYTPVPGGIGPLTVVGLFKNLIGD